MIQRYPDASATAYTEIRNADTKVRRLIFFEKYLIIGISKTFKKLYVSN